MFKLSLYCSLICIFLAISYPKTVTADESEESLRKALFSNYLRTVIPVENHTQPIQINIALIVNHIDIDDINTKSAIYGYLDLEWHDRKLQWNPNDFGDLSNIYLTIDKLWIPDISLYNTANGILLDLKHEGTIKVSSNGMVKWTPHVKFETYCNLSLKHWPFDKQVCSFILGSWVHSSSKLTPMLSENRPILNILSQNHIWKITETNAFILEKIYSCCPEPYPSITFTFDLERKSPMLNWFVITPMIGIVLMCLAVFWIPPYRGEKILLNGFTLIINAYFIHFFVKKLPSSIEELPLTILFQITSFILLTISMLLSVVLLRLTRNLCGIQKINQGLNKFLHNNTLSNIFCLPYGNENSLQKDQTELKDHFEDGKSADNNLLIKTQQNLENSENDVIIMATFIDRIFFYIYLILFVVLFLICFI